MIRVVFFMGSLLLISGDANANIFGDVIGKVKHTADDAKNTVTGQHHGDGKSGNILTHVTDPLKKVGNTASKVGDKVMHAPTAIAKQANKATDAITNTTNHLIDKTGVGNTLIGQGVKAGVSAVGDTAKQFQTDAGNVTEIEMRYTGGLPFALQKQTARHFVQEYNQQHEASAAQNDSKIQERNTAVPAISSGVSNEVKMTNQNTVASEISSSTSSSLPVDMDDLDRLFDEIDEMIY